MRLGEALAISWENLDSRNCQYNVAETTRHGRFGPPKSGKRHIDLDETLVAKLDTHIKKLRKDCMTAGVLPHYLFPGITQRMVQTAMRRGCMAGPHDLRHTYATILLMAHISPAYVQKQLGHHSISMTVDIYGHWVTGGAGTPGPGPTAQGKTGESFYADAGAGMSSAKFDRMDRVKIIEEKVLFSSGSAKCSVRIRPEGQTKGVTP